MLVAGRFHHLRVCFSLRSTNRSVEFHPSLLRCWLSPVWYLLDINIANYGIIVSSNINGEHTMAQLPSISTKTYFTLIYSERSVRSDALIALCGPSIHHSEQEALRLLWVYVRNRIIDVGMVEEFLESVMGYEDGDMELTDEDAVLASMPGEQLKVAVNWYFDFMNDECCECFYQIDKHLVTEGKSD